LFFFDFPLSCRIKTHIFVEVQFIIVLTVLNIGKMLLLHYDLTFILALQETVCIKGILTLK